MTLLFIVMATVAGGLLSVLIAAVLTTQLLSRLVHNMVSLSAGVLLGAALLHLLPEALNSSAGATELFATLLAGLLFFWLLEKVELFRHQHHHEGDGHEHHAHFDTEQAGRGGYAVLIGDSVHNFCDGVIIAAAFLADTTLGIVTALAIVAHEVPQEVGDYIVLLNAGFTRRKALFFNALSGMAAVLGGVLGYFVVGPWEDLFPYLLMVAASSFIYVALADLLPQMQRRLPLGDVLKQVLWLVTGLAIIVLAMRLLHSH